MENLSIYSVLLYVQAFFYVVAGLLHFLKTKFYLRIMPPYLPFPKELVYLSGVAEILLGLGLLSPFRSLAAIGIILLLVAVFPANIYSTFQNPKAIPGIPLWVLYCRLPLQFVFIYWAWIYI